MTEETDSNFCFVCMYMCTCTCTDYLIKSLSCKHIHTVHMARNNVEIKPVVEENDCPDYTHSLEVLKSLVHQEKLQTSSTYTERLKELDLQRLNDIIALLTTSMSYNVLRALVDGMQNAYSYTIACGLQKKGIVHSILKRSLIILPTKILKSNTVWFL